MEYRAPKLDITYEQMRSLLMETLRGNWGNQLTSLNHSIPPVALRLGLMEISMHLPEHDRRGEAVLSPADFACVQNIIWDLIIERIVRPGLNDCNNNDFPFFHLTERGMQILADGPQAPYDPDGYLKWITSETPDVNLVIITYLKQAFLCPEGVYDAFAPELAETTEPAHFEVLLEEVAK